MLFSIFGSRAPVSDGRDETMPRPPQKLELLAGRRAGRLTGQRFDEHLTVTTAEILGDRICRSCREALDQDDGLHVESLLGMLAALGGFSCAVAAHGLVTSRRSAVTWRDLQVVTSAEGYPYISGDFPNRFLLDDDHSLLNLALAEVRACGAAFPAAAVRDTLKHASASGGPPDRVRPRVPGLHAPLDLPIAYVASQWVEVEAQLQQEIIFPPQYPQIFGFAIAQAIRNTRELINPFIAGRIILEYAVPMTRVLPGTVALEKRGFGAGSTAMTEKYRAL